MKILSLVLAGLLFVVGPVLAETIVDGVVYPEITQLGQARTVRALPAPTAYVAQLPQPHLSQARAWQARATGYRNTTIAPADLQPALDGTVQSVPAYNQAVYGRGYTTVGTPQRVVYVQPASYTNTVPVQQQVQPIAYSQPPSNLQPLGTTPYNPYVQSTPGVPWRPIVNIRSMPANYVVGQGIIGQPKVYVPSQPVRNFLRYITP